MHLGAVPIGAAPIGAGAFAQVVLLSISCSLPVEARRAASSAAQWPIELKLGAKAVGAAPFERLMRLAQVVADDGFSDGTFWLDGFGWATYSLSGAPGRIETLTESGGVSQVQVLPFEFGQPARLVAALAAEHLVALRGVGASPIDLSLSAYASGASPVEQLTQPLVLKRLPIEWTGALLTQMIAVFPLELKVGVAGRGDVGIDAKTVLLSAGTLAAESKLQTVAAGATWTDVRTSMAAAATTLSAEILAGAKTVGVLSGEWQGELITVSVSVLGIETLRQMQSVPVLFHVEQLERAALAAGLLPESLASTVAAAIMDAEAIRPVTVSRELLAETLGRISGIDQVVKAELLRGERSLILVPIEAQGQRTFVMAVTRIITEPGQSWTFTEH